MDKATVQARRDAVGYEPKPLIKRCSTCTHFASDIVIPKWMIGNPGREAEFAAGRIAGNEANLRCTLLGFAVKRTAVCAAWTEQE
ncbi:hypothetical protein [Nevskia ramosa]|uniref:hypothetical protein n=1 Tax=Nevskia ramosa TaxID=64002 RepID=UPI003D0BED73